MFTFPLPVLKQTRPKWSHEYKFQVLSHVIRRTDILICWFIYTQPRYEESNLSDTYTIEHEAEPDSTTEFPPSDEELVDLDTNGETSTQEDNKPDTVSKLPASSELSKLIFLEKITDNFSHKRIVGKDGTYTRGSHKVFVYKVRMVLSLS
jgi:hypothetical protein